MPLRVRDHPEDAGFARTYAALPDATDLEPWLGWARSAGGPVLYAGPGAGRLAIPLWRSGVQMVGVEPHPGMVALLAERLPALEVIPSALESADLGGRAFPLVIGPSAVLSEPAVLAAAARASSRWVGLELLNPHWLLGPGRQAVTVRSTTARRARIAVPYPNGDVQEATVRLRWPETVHLYLSRAGLRLQWLGGQPGCDLESSPTYFALGVRGGQASPAA